MKITIIGGGAIGLVLAASLENKSEVSVLVKPEKFKKLSEKGLWIVENNIKRRINAKVVNDMKEPDIVIIAVKGYDLEKTNELLNDFKGKLIICQNGLKMLDFNPPNNNEIFAIVTSIGAESLEEGITEFKGTGNTLLGNLHNVINDSKDMLNLFSTKYFKISHKTNIKNYIWLKAVINSAINPIASHHGIKNGELKKEKYWESVRELLSESVNIAKSNDINFAEEPIKLTEEIIEMTANNICSMLQDITKGRKTEINEINGALIQIGKKNDVSTRLNSKYLEKIKVLN